MAPDAESPLNQLPKRKDRDYIKSLNPVRVSFDSHGGALSEIARRVMIDFEEEWI